MAMIQYGYVTEVLDSAVKVKVNRESACGGNCVSCKGCANDAVIVTCPIVGKEKFNIGDCVKIEMPTTTFFKGAFGGYILMSILTIVCAVLGYIFYKNEGMSVLGGVVGLIIGLICVKLLFGKENALTVTKLNIKDEEDK